jgi:ribosomal protein S3AE
MATTRKSTKSTAPAVLEETETEAAEAETTAEATPKQLINEAIGRVVEAHGIDVQKNRYKAMRAIAFQAFQEAIDSGDFDGLVERAIANIDELPSGWEIERVAKDEAPAKAAPKAKAPVKKAAPAKAAAAKAATTRRRPAR